MVRKVLKNMKDDFSILRDCFHKKEDIVFKDGVLDEGIMWGDLDWGPKIFGNLVVNKRR